MLYSAQIVRFVKPILREYQPKTSVKGIPISAGQFGRIVDIGALVLSYLIAEKT